MNWKVEWTWENDNGCHSGVEHFTTRRDAMSFIKMLKENPYREITSMYLTHIKKLIQICAICHLLFSPQCAILISEREVMRYVKRI